MHRSPMKTKGVFSEMRVRVYSQSENAYATEIVFRVNQNEWGLVTSLRGEREAPVLMTANWCIYYSLVCMCVSVACLFFCVRGYISGCARPEQNILRCAGVKHIWEPLFYSIYTLSPDFWVGDTSAHVETHPYWLGYGRFLLFIWSNATPIEITFQGVSVHQFQIYPSV